MLTELFRREFSRRESYALSLGAAQKAVAEASGQTATAPSDDQRQAGNFRKGKVRLHGLTIAIENPKGSTRSGKSRDGREWSVVMPWPYGYILRTTSEADGDHVDVFLGPHLDSEVVFIVNQQKPGGRFDEHKVMLGWKSAHAAKRAYLSAYSAGWTGFGGLVAMTMPEFHRWLEKGDTSKRAEPYRKPALVEKFARAFAARGFVERYEAGWITIGGQPEEGGGEHHGGTPVLLDDHGHIAAGPDKLEGKHVNDLGAKGDSKADDFDFGAREKPAEPQAASKPAGTGHAQAGQQFNTAPPALQKLLATAHGTRAARKTGKADLEGLSDAVAGEAYRWLAANDGAAGTFRAGKTRGHSGPAGTLSITPDGGRYKASYDVQERPRAPAKPAAKMPGQATRVGAAVRQEASQWGLDPDELWSTAAEMLGEVRNSVQERETALASLRRGGDGRRNIDAGRIAAHERAGGDHSTFPGWDEFAREAATMHPELGLANQTDGGYLESRDDAPAALWDMLAHGRKEQPRQDDPRLLRQAAEWLYESKRRPVAAHNDSVPFSRKGHVERYARSLYGAGLVERFGKAFAQRGFGRLTLAERLQREFYARRKPASGQGSLFEEQHPRDDDGKFAEKSGGGASTADEPFTLGNVPEKKGKPKGEDSDKGKQKTLLSGMDALPGQGDLFEVDGGGDSPTWTGSPLQSFDQLKSQNPDHALLFRVGDFMELFHADAEQAARAAGLTLMRRTQGRNEIPMAGFPAKSLDRYLPRLEAAGLKTKVVEEEIDSEAAESNSRPETYIGGDRGEYTGETEVVGGETFHKVLMMEGIHAGKTRLTQRGPDGSDPHVAKKRKEWQEEQAGWRSLRAAEAERDRNKPPVVPLKPRKPKPPELFAR